LDSPDTRKYLQSLAVLRNGTHDAMLFKDLADKLHRRLRHGSKDASDFRP
jgi:hypothetical protein